jgi:hypothetical protein
VPATDREPTLAAARRLALSALAAAQQAEALAGQSRIAAEALVALLNPGPSVADAALLAELRRAFPARTAFWSQTVEALAAENQALALAVAAITRPGKSETVAVSHALRRLRDQPTDGAVVRPGRPWRGLDVGA